MLQQVIKTFKKHSEKLVLRQAYLLHQVITNANTGAKWPRIQPHYSSKSKVRVIKYFLDTSLPPLEEFIFHSSRVND